MGCEVDVTRHVTCHITTTSYIMAMSSATSSSMSSLCDMAIESVTKIILFVMLIFVIENGFGLGFGGLGTFHDGFKTSCIERHRSHLVTFFKFSS